MSYKKHVFVCTTGSTCPGQGSQAVRDELKRLVKGAGLGSEIRVNNCGCLGQCGLGPNMVIYPEGTWYSGVELPDVPRIFESLQSGEQIDTLLNEFHHPRKTGL